MIRIIDIDNLNAPELEPYAHLNENQLKHYWEPNGGLFIGESPNVILRALDAGYAPVSLLMESKYIETEGAEILRKVDRWSGRRRYQPPEAIPVYVSTLDVLSKITGYHLTRGILCAFRRKPLPSVEEVCRNARRIAVLENIENPTNVGAIIRSAAALGMDAVLLTPECADPLYRRAIRVSVGTVFQVPWTYIGMPERHYTWMKKLSAGSDLQPDSDSEKLAGNQTDWPTVGMNHLHELGFRAAAMALQHDTISIDDPRLHAESRLAVILGNEGEGLLPETIAACDYTIKIPMSHGVDSLNVAAASAVAFWELSGR